MCENIEVDIAVDDSEFKHEISKFSKNIKLFSIYKHKNNSIFYILKEDYLNGIGRYTRIDDLYDYNAPHEDMQYYYSCEEWENKNE